MVVRTALVPNVQRNNLDTSQSSYLGLPAVLLSTQRIHLPIQIRYLMMMRHPATLEQERTPIT